jgi:predicted aminopeptidase
MPVSAITSAICLFLQQLCFSIISYSSKYRQRISYAGVFLQCVFLLFSFLLLGLFTQLDYLLLQLKGQLSMSFSARSLEEALADSKVPVKQKEGILFTMHVLQFASSRGLQTGNAYTRYCDPLHEKQMWMLSAAPPFSFRPYEWSFPLFGSFSYKGYFDLGMALTEKKRLESKGYDTDLGKAAGWSTLGWFPDPVTASMLERKPYDLAELLLHELVHKTVYLHDSVEWNENLAVLCARRLCIDFLKNAGQDDWLQAYQRSLQAEDSLIAFAEYGKSWLMKHYANGPNTAEEKARLMHHLAQDFLARPWAAEFSRYRIAASILTDGNAWFLSHHRYGGGMKELGEMLEKQHHGNVMSLLKALKK